MAEISNKMVERVLRKDSSGSDWYERIPAVAKAVNSRAISDLLLSPPQGTIRNSDGPRLCLWNVVLRQN